MNKVDKSVICAVLVAAAAFFIWDFYFFIVSIFATSQLIVESQFFIEQTAVTWWTLLFYATEIVPSFGVLFRFIVGIITLYAGIIYTRRGAEGLSLIRGKVSIALLLEAGYYLTLIPAMLTGFAYGIFGGGLWYYGNTPLIVVFLLSGLVSIADIFVVVPMLLRLRAAVVGASSTEEIIKRGSKTAICYLFVIFWFIYTMSWFSSLVPWNARAQPGISILLNPLDLISFIATVVGLFALAFYAYKVLLPSINKGEKPNLRRVGVILTGLGIYFLLMTVLFITYGGYHGHPTVWMEMIMPVHNPDFWCLSFIFSGPILSLKSREESQ